MSPYYGPVGEKQSDIDYERNFMAGDVVVGTGYGAQLMLYVSCALFLWKRRKQTPQSMFLLAYMSFMLLIESLFIAVQARTVQMIYIENRNYPGGPWAFFLASQTAGINVTFYATLFLLTFLSDILVLWRCWVIWAASGQTTLAWIVITFPGICLLASFVLGTLWTLQSSQPNLSLYSKLPMAYGISYYAISLSTNIILTLLIIGRLAVHRRTLLKNLPEDLAGHYISLATIIVESAALYSVFAALFLVTYAINNPTNQIWLGVTSACQQIANLLIIYRVAEGSAWQMDTLTSKAPPIHFKSYPDPSTHGGSFHIVAPSTSTGSFDPELTSKDERSEVV
ncbi:hypothetical protein GGX14DRAFT_401918 [Mycena pura]|uniref:Uncharacterized protein n=1 Tax=Mycena pura TaxID=153505 RepID=A0AAD6Y7Y0_9AGAR|nr:hypothetical protein GGX14DRAFT_401918 [Mycena pura]